MNLKRKTRIKLTEADLRSIVKEATKRILREDNNPLGEQRNYVAEAMQILREMENKYKKIVRMYDNGRQSSEDDFRHMSYEMSTLLFNDLHRAITTLSNADY